MLKKYFVILMLLILLVFTCNYLKKTDRDSYRKNYVGNFILDLEASEVSYADSLVLRDKALNLKLSAEGEFEFSFYPNFIFKQSGFWSIESAGISDFAVLKYSNSSFTDQFTFTWTIDSLYIVRYPIPKKGYEDLQAKLLVFKKVN